MGCFGKQSPCVDPLQPRLVCVRFEALFWLGSGQIPLTTPSWGGGRIASFHFRSQAASFLLIKFAFLGLCDQLRLASNCLGNGCNHQTQDDGRGHYVSGCLSASCGGLHNRGGESLLSPSRSPFVLLQDTSERLQTASVLDWEPSGGEQLKLNDRAGVVSSSL